MWALCGIYGVQRFGYIVSRLSLPHKEETLCGYEFQWEKDHVILDEITFFVRFHILAIGKPWESSNIVEINLD